MTAGDAERKQQAKLAENESQFRDIMEAAQVWIFFIQDDLFLYVNAFLLDLFVYVREEVIGPLDLIDAEQHAFVREQMQARQSGVPGQRYEIDARRKDGSMFPASILGSPSTYAGRPASVGTLLDLSVQKAAEQRIRELADFDPLTGLPNRRLLRDRVDQLLAVGERDGTPVTLVFLDLDHFKRINDSLGHSVGDEVLIALANRLSGVVRRGDTLSRLGVTSLCSPCPGSRRRLRSRWRGD